MIRSVKKFLSVSGSTFFCNDSGRNTMRINFSFSNNEEIEEAVRPPAGSTRNEMNGK